MTFFLVVFQGAFIKHDRGGQIVGGGGDEYSSSPIEGVMEVIVPPVCAEEVVVFLQFETKRMRQLSSRISIPQYSVVNQFSAERVL